MLLHFLYIYLLKRLINRSLLQLHRQLLMHHIPKVEAIVILIIFLIRVIWVLGFLFLFKDVTAYTITFINNLWFDHIYNLLKLICFYLSSNLKLIFYVLEGFYPLCEVGVRGSRQPFNRAIFFGLEGKNKLFAVAVTFSYFFDLKIFC